MRYNRMDGMEDYEIFDLLDEEFELLVAGDLDAYIAARAVEVDDG